MKYKGPFDRSSLEVKKEEDIKKAKIKKLVANLIERNKDSKPFARLPLSSHEFKDVFLDKYRDKIISNLHQKRKIDEVKTDEIDEYILLGILEEIRSDAELLEMKVEKPRSIRSPLELIAEDEFPDELQDGERRYTREEFLAFKAEQEAIKTLAGQASKEQRKNLNTALREGLTEEAYGEIDPSALRE